MKRTLTALTLAASLAAFTAPAVQAQGMGESLTMLELAVESVFTQVGVEGVDVMSLSLAQLAQIKAVLDGDQDNSTKRSRILAIVN